MTGSGNDFVIVDGRSSSPDDWSASDIQAVCARGTGVGADGIVFLGPGSVPGAVRMAYFNSDGSRAALCGNAALCSTRLAAHLGLGSSVGMRLETDAGTYESRCNRADGRAELRLAPVAPPAAVPELKLHEGEQRAVLGVVGVPHLIVLVDDVEHVDLGPRGKALREDLALGSEGANVNFVAPGGGPSEWRMRSYERGVEGETLACGTGAVAVACALEHWNLATLPITLWTRSGRCLEVKGRRGESGGYEDVWLVGEARLVLRGVLM
jgi:diaminopimelate epimerase